MVGINTVLSDNPSLDCRLNGLKDRSPIKLIVDTDLKTPLDSILVENAKNDLVISPTHWMIIKLILMRKKVLKLYILKKIIKDILKLMTFYPFSTKWILIDY